MDGTLVETTGACKAGMDIAYDGTWGYHPLVVSLANTGEVLSVLNRPGNRPSHEGAAAEVDRALRVCLEGGFRRVLLRGDTDFSQTKHLDRWAADSRVHFIFGLDATSAKHILADDLPPQAWRPLERPPRYQVKTAPRTRPERVKEQIVRARQFENIRLESEEVAEMPYRPTACAGVYRLVIVRKNLAIEKGEQRLFDDYRYFYYLTNDWDKPAVEIVFGANGRCNQENLNAQLKGAVRARNGARGQSGEQLGLHGDGGLGVESEGLVGAVADAALGTLAGAISAGASDRAANGVQNVRQCVRAAALSDYSSGSAANLSRAQLESVAEGVLPHVRAVAALTRSYRSRSLDAPVRRGIAGTSWSGRKVKMSNSKMDYRTPAGAGRFPAQTESLKINTATWAVRLFKD